MCSIMIFQTPPSPPPPYFFFFFLLLFSTLHVFSFPPPIHQYSSSICPSFSPPPPQDTMPAVATEYVGKEEGTLKITLTDPEQVGMGHFENSRIVLFTARWFNSITWFCFRSNYVTCVCLGFTYVFLLQLCMCLGFTYVFCWFQLSVQVDDGKNKFIAYTVNTSVNGQQSMIFGYVHSKKREFVFFLGNVGEGGGGLRVCFWKSYITLTILFDTIITTIALLVFW